MACLVEKTSTYANPVPSDLAQLSSVFTAKSLISLSDINSIQDIQQQVHNSGQCQNPQNDDRVNKHCTFLSRPSGPSLPPNPLRSLAPRILGKLLRFASTSWKSGDWSGPAGPLAGIGAKDVGGLSLRIAEHWHYAVGGSLDNDHHFDNGSVITIVTALNDEFTGGLFRTFENDKTHKVHPLRQGDSACFISHKYHNVTPVLTDFRESLVIELWEGGISMHGR